MNSPLIIALLFSTFLLADAAPAHTVREAALEIAESFDLGDLDSCEGRGLMSGGSCQCFPHFSGDHCEIFETHACSQDQPCPKHSYCLTKSIDCLMTSHCKDRRGWCVPFDLP